MALSPSASGSLVPQKRPVSSLFVGREVKRPKCGGSVQEAALRFLLQNQNVEDLLTESSSSLSGSTEPLVPSTLSASLLMGELKRESERRRVALTTVTVGVFVQRLKKLTRLRANEELLTSPDRAQLCGLLESSRELLSQGALCPKLLWKELTREEKFPKLEVVFHLHSYNIVSLQDILESPGVRSWLVSELKTLCSWSPGDDHKQVQEQVLTLVLQVLVGSGFEVSEEGTSLNKRLCGVCSSVLDQTLFWLLEAVEKNETSSSPATGAQTWIELLDSTLCGTLVSAEALRRFFKHCLTKTLTYQPRLTVSSAIELQNQWTFAKTSPLLTNLFCQLSMVFSVEQLFSDLQQILSTHEVNWRHVLSFLSTVLVYNSSAQNSLTELLDVLLRAAFQSYDLESVITAFLLARQGALEGPAVFPSYSDWFKRCFGASSSPHASSKKALVFLLKFLSDLVPFEPPQYLKVHLLHPPFVPLKHRSLLQEYVSLAKTRLSDLKESLEDMGLYEDVSAAPTEQSQRQEELDVEKAVSLFESTGRISATVMEASIFRRPYFLTRFLPVLLTPRALPNKADVRMKFIEALKKAEKIPPAQFSSYVESCEKEKHNDTVSDPPERPVEVLGAQLDSIREALTGDQRELSALMSRMSHTLSVLCPPQTHTDVIRLPTDLPTDLPPHLHGQVVNMILRSFCQCVLDSSKQEPSTKQMSWASRFVLALTENRAVFRSLVLRLWDLFQNQVTSLGAAHVLGLAVFVVHLHSCSRHCPLVELQPSAPGPVCVSEAVCSGLRCDTHTHMLFSLRFCLVAVSFAVCRRDADPHQLIPSTLYKKLLYLVPRLLPRARMPVCDEAMDEVPRATEEGGSWRRATEEGGSWRRATEEGGSWRRATEEGGSWRSSALSLWRDPAFRSLQLNTQFQLTFSEWFHNELQVCRGEDALSDPERREYHEWVFMELFLPRPESDGGFGGDVETLCCRLITAVLDHEVNDGAHHRGAQSVLPDVLSRLQTCVYDLWLSGRSGRAQMGRVCLELLSHRFSSVPSARLSAELVLRRTLHSWNRVLLALPSSLLLSTGDCQVLIDHINQHQRTVCSPENVLPCHISTHIMKGLLCSISDLSEDDRSLWLDSSWSQIVSRCPLLLVSFMFWWDHMCVTLSSMWGRCPQFASLSQCHRWAQRAVCGQVDPAPSAPPLQLAACLYRALHDRGGRGDAFVSALRREQQTEVLVFLLSLCVNLHLTSLLHPETKRAHTDETCTALLSELIDSPDWLSVFKSAERGVFDTVALLVSDDLNRLRPWAFYSVLCEQTSDLWLRAQRCPGFIHTAVLCYTDLLRLFIDGRATPQTGQVEPSVLVQSKKLLLRCLSQMTGSALSSSQRQQLQDLCADLDPEVTAALRYHDNLSLSPEMDFL